jgi:2-dehydropantoate 2-reductase
MTGNQKTARIAVLGAGAVGCYFGGMLARSGLPVTFIGRPRHVEAIQQRGLTFQSAHYSGIIPAAAFTSAEAVRGADVVLLCVKTLDTEDAARKAAPHLSPETVVVSLQNGVDNVERIRRSTGIEAVPAVVYVACEMVAPGTLQHNGRGDLILGNSGARTAAVARLFENARVPCRLSDNIEVDLWGKMIVNCVYNAMSALSRARYARLAGNPLTANLMRLIVEEAVTVAGRLGVPLDTEALNAAALELGVSMAAATSSMAQDLARGRKTEIDSLNGYVVRRAAELGVPAPANQVLHGLVKALEESLEAQ